MHNYKIFLTLCILIRQSEISNNDATESTISINEYENMIMYDNEQIMQIYDTYKKEYENKTNELMFLDTYIRFTNINKKEKHNGDMLAIDVGGSYLKLGIYNKNLQEVFEVKRYKINRDDQTKDIDLFDWISDKIKEYIAINYYDKVYTIKDKYMYAAMTFSYPVKHLGLSKGIILKMTKDFPFKPINEDIDPVKRMNEALKKSKLQILVKILLNDTTSTLLASYYMDNEVSMGIVLGTGTNCAFISQNKIINSEWGMFDGIEIKESRLFKYLNKDRNFNLDELIGGLGFIKLLKVIFKDENDVENIVKKYYDGSLSEKDLKIIYLIKKRCYLTISILVAALDAKKENETLKIGLNGSGFENNNDLKIFKRQLSYVYSLFANYTKKIYFFRIENASLLGSVFALSNNGQIFNESLSQ